MRVAIRFLLASLLLATACSGIGRLKEKLTDIRTNEPLVCSNISILGVSSGSRGDASSPPTRDGLIPSSYVSPLKFTEGNL